MSAPGSAPTILIVDDTEVNLILLHSVLDAEGFRTLTAADGASARRLSRSEVPDLILLDVVMPGESGFETCAKLKSDPKTAHIPIIFLSAQNDVKSKVRGLKVGGVDYVTKPVHGEEVLARVRVHLRIGANNRAITRQHQARLEELRDAGLLLSGDPLHPVDAATTVRVRNDETEILDGPFAVTKEFLVGYFLLECADLDEALSLIPGKHRLNVHACYAETNGKRVERNEAAASRRVLAGAEGGRRVDQQADAARRHAAAPMRAMNEVAADGERREARLAFRHPVTRHDPRDGERRRRLAASGPGQFQHGLERGAVDDVHHPAAIADRALLLRRHQSRRRRD